MHPTTVEFLARDHLDDLRLDPHLRDLAATGDRPRSRAAASARVAELAAGWFATVRRAASAAAKATAAMGDRFRIATTVIARRRAADLRAAVDLLGVAARPAAVGPAGSTQGSLVARFMDVHSGFIGVTREQLQAAHEADQAIEDDEGMHFERAWLDPESGKAFCISTGPTKEALMRIHERAGHPTAEVYEIPIEVA